MAHLYGLDAAGTRLAQTAASIAAEVAARHAEDVDRKGRFPKESVAALAEAGLFGLCLSPSVGGAGQAPRTFAAVAEELGQVCASTAMIYVMHVTAAQAIASATTLAGRDDLLRQIAAGKHLTTLALSERGSRSQFWAPVSKLVEQGTGYTTHAHKSWVTSANHADSYVSTAQRPGAASPLESTIYLIRRGSAGVRVAASFDGLGLRGNDSTAVEIEGLAVAKGDLISDLGAGATTKLEVILPWFSVGTAAMANGLCRAAVAATAKHLAGTGFEHTGTQLRDLPTLRARLARMSARTEQARALLGYTVAEMEHPSETTPLFVLQSRFASLEAAVDVTDGAMKACGGAAFSRQLGVERTFRDARAGWVMAPTADHLLEFVGRALTGLPLF
ncbi:MAG: acyl-CoA dehydrogenase [Myxococcales bacterium]|nr:acyl-CoA dehydrogenase [Myxococcales bacterium]